MPRRRAPAPHAVTSQSSVSSDSVDRLIADWARARPDLDMSPLGVIARLGRLRAYIDTQLERVFAEHGLSGPAFSVLVTLARLNQPEGVSQRHLLDELGLTSGTVSVRIDRLVEQGLVLRRPDPRDRRNTRITLTQRGRALFERVAPAHLENERHLLSSLTSAENELLATLLRKLLIEFEGSHITDDGTIRLGVTLAPAHVSVSMRRAVGLPPVAGLLVLAVVDDSPAAAAGVEQGDVLLRAGRRALRSIADLHETLAEVSPGHGLRLSLQRGLSEHPLRLMLPAIPTSLSLASARSHQRPTSAQHTV